MIVKYFHRRGGYYLQNLSQVSNSTKTKNAVSLLSLFIGIDTQRGSEPCIQCSVAKFQLSLPPARHQHLSGQTTSDRDCVRDRREREMERERGLGGGGGGGPRCIIFLFFLLSYQVAQNI